MSGDARSAARRLAWERLARSLHSRVSFSHRGNSSGPNRSRGGISRTTRYTRGLVIRGIFFPPSLLQAQEKRSAQQAHGYVVMPSRPEPAPYLIRGAGLILVQPHAALLRLELGFDAPPGAFHVCQGL